MALGDAAREAGDIAAAMEWYQQVLEISKGHPEARERMASIRLSRADRLASKKE